MGPDFENRKTNGDGEEVRKLPEFIYVEEENKHYHQQPHVEMPFDFGMGVHPQQEATKVPKKLHLFCGVAAIASIFWVIGVFLFFIVSAIISGCLLFSNEHLNNITLDYWKSFKKACVITTGLIIGIFSPYLGFVLVFSYLLLQGEQGQQGFIARVLQSQFHPYMHK